MRALSRILSDESLSYSFLRGNTSQIMEEHSSPTSIFPVFMMTSLKGTCSASLAFVRGIHRWLRGIHRSPVNSPHTDQWRGALMFSLICAWTNGWVNNQDSGDMRRHRAYYDVTVMWLYVPNSDPGSRGIFRRSTRHSCPILKWWGSAHYGWNGLKFGTLLYPD